VQSFIVSGIGVAMPVTQPSFFDLAQPADVAQQLESFTYNGQKTLVEERAGVRFFINEFWTARQRQAHSIHEVSYRACFKPQLPEFFISRLTEPGDTVYDPFMGRGTTPIQANLMGRRAIGNDINPVSTLLTRPRMAPPTLHEIDLRLRQVPWEAGRPEPADLLVFYHPGTLRQITALREYLLQREAAGSLDKVDDWIRMVAINRLTGHSSGFFSVYSLPPNQAVSVAAQVKINERRKQTPPERSVPKIIIKKSRSLLSDAVPRTVTLPMFLTGPADASGLPEASVDLVVTSPPFLDVVQYAADNWLRCWFAGLKAERVAITMHRKVDQWEAFTASVLTDLVRIVRRGGHIAYEVGEVRGGKLHLEQLVLSAARNLPLRPIGVMINVQEFTKTANCWGVSNNSKGTNTNRIVLFSRQ
jgi:hypothetical protein